MKISWGDELPGQFTTRQFLSLVRFLDSQKVDAVEVSYGTMDHALNIFRGGIPLDQIFQYNPFYRIESPLGQELWKLLVFPFIRQKFRPFTPVYNLHHASLARKESKLKIISVGGFRTYEEISGALWRGETDYVALSRPFIREPGLVKKLRSGNYTSSCENCNKCAIMCDSQFPTKCYNLK